MASAFNRIYISWHTRGGHAKVFEQDNARVVKWGFNNVEGRALDVSEGQSLDVLRCLQAEHKRFTPEAKLFWLRLGKFYSVGKPVCETVRVLSKRLGLGERVIARAVCDLANIQGVDEQVGFKPIWAWREVASRGRPQGYYLAAPWPKAPITPYGKLGGDRELLIAKILFDERKPTFKGRGKRLTLTNRLLLALLVSLAGTCGEVRGISKLRLRAMTGMTNERLDNQLEKLLRLGYLFGWVGGGTGKHILGVKVGVYWVNLKKCAEAFGVDCGYPRRFLVDFDHYQIGEILTYKEAGRRELPIKVVGPSALSVIWTPAKSRVIRFFEVSPGARLGVVLQQSLEEASTWIAERIVPQGPVYSPNEERKAFKQRYRSIFLPPSVLADNTLDTEEAVEGLMSYLWTLCREMAGEVVRLVYERYSPEEVVGKDIRLELVTFPTKSPGSRRLLVNVSHDKKISPEQESG